MKNISDIELREVLKHLTEKLTVIIHYINEYENLFGKDDDTSELISKTKSRFFGDLQLLYWNFLTIRICGILDKPETAGNKNLSIPLLIEYVKEKKLPCKNDVIQTFYQIDEKIRPFKRMRNKVFVHFDLNVIAGKQKIEDMDFDNLISIVLMIGDIINRVNTDFGGGNSLWGVKSLDGTKRLLVHIKMAMEYKKLLPKIYANK